MCFVWISEQTAIISLYSTKLSVFKTEAESVYCAVRTGSLYQTVTASYLNSRAVTVPTGWLSRVNECPTAVQPGDQSYAGRSKSINVQPFKAYWLRDAPTV